MNHNTMNANAPDWLRLFVDGALPGLLDATLIGCHYFHNVPANEWEVSLFELPTEIYGGPADGMQIPSNLRIDIAAVALAFDSPPRIYWQAERICDGDELGNHLSFEGITGGFSVWLRILRNSPPEFGPGRRVHAPAGTVEDSL